MTTRITITIVRANHLYPKFFSIVRPYVILSVDGKYAFETDTDNDESDPSWNESFTTDVSPGTSLKFGVFNWRNHHKSNRGYMSGVWFTVSSFINLEQSGSRTLTLDLHDDGWLTTYAGTLTVRLSW